jgi:hypothetical protein
MSHLGDLLPGVPPGAPPRRHPRCSGVDPGLVRPIGLLTAASTETRDPTSTTSTSEGRTTKTGSPIEGGDAT